MDSHQLFVVIPHTATTTWQHEDTRTDASSETKYVSAIVEANALPALAEMLHSPFADSAELAALALGNVAGESVALRDAVVRTGAVEGVAAALAEHAGADVPRSFAAHGAWALAAMFRGTPRPPAPVLRPALGVLVRLAGDEHAETAESAAWALAFYTDGGADVADVVAAGAVPAAVALLDRGEAALDVPAARLLANVACGDADAGTALVEAGALPRACALLGDSRVAVRREACWMLANVAAGPSAHAEAVAGEGGLVPRLVAVALCDAETPAVRTEAHFALANLLLCAGDAAAAQLAHTQHYLRALAHNATLGDDTAEAFVRALARAQAVLERPGSFEAANRTFAALLADSGADDVLRTIHDPELQDTIHKILSSLETETSTAPQPGSLDDIE